MILFRTNVSGKIPLLVNGVVGVPSLLMPLLPNVPSLC